MGPHAELVNALAPTYATPPLVDALLAAAAPMHAADGWGAVFEQDPGFSVAPPSTLAAVAAARGVVVVRGLDVSPEELSALVNHGVGPGGKRRPARRFRRRARRARDCLLYTSPSPRDGLLSRMPSSA